MKNEFEARFLDVDPSKMREALKLNGFKRQSQRFLMQRQTFDFASKPAGIKKWARVRSEALKTTMTIKEIRGKGIDDVYEAEVAVDSFDNGVEFLKAAGLTPGPFQENYREEWIKGPFYVTIDDWPRIPTFVEIEGPTEAEVNAISRSLNLEPSESVFGSIDLLYERYHAINEDDFNKIMRLEFSD